MKTAKENFASLAEKKIFILGPRTMQNDLLASFLTESTGAKCVTGMSMEEPLSDGSNGTMILWDCQGRTSRSILSEIQLYSLERYLVLLINLSQDSVIEKDAVEKGIRGFLYENESFDKLPKAIRAVSNGELWLSREFMSNWILSTKGAGLAAGEQSGLTSKEVQILRLIADGASNKELGKKLFISTNTAKTHVYNIFKKINVTNRLQAALWAKKNLS
jgi:LuxR family transcriptional regulator, positive regulator of biofilm formation